jgi:hypothetical protein
MAKQAISVTLDTDNLTWLKGGPGAAGLRSVSELLDQLVTAARESGRIGPSRSVVGTIDIDASDPLLEGADDVVRGMYEMSLRRPLMVKGNEGRVSDHAAKETAAWLIRRPPSPTRMRSSSTPRAGESSAPALPSSSNAASGATRFSTCRPS